PNVDNAENVLFAVDARSAADAWSVGYVDTGESFQESLVLRWDGFSWIRVPSPNPGTLQNILRGVTILSADDVWAVGDYFGPFHSGPLIMHWDGSSWIQFSGWPIP